MRRRKTHQHGDEQIVAVEEVSASDPWSCILADVEAEAVSRVVRRESAETATTNGQTDGRKDRIITVGATETTT